MKYTARYTTRWHDTDAFRRVRPTQLLVYMQETSNRHIKSLGCSLDELRDQKKLAFILSKIRLAIYEPLYMGEDISVETWTYETHGIGTGRFYRILKDEKTVAEADTTWALVDIEHGGLVHVDSCGYPFEHEEVPTVEIPNRMKVPKEGSFEEIDKRRIVYSDLDYNMHMNNTKYADMLMDYIPIEETGRVKGFLLSYLREASYGDVLSILSKCVGDSFYFKTVNKEGKVCLEAQVLFDKELEGHN
ncbi:MAG: hypothetical protein J6Q78_07060 [Clostridia bacterium]|jgi:acyl-ACP thioesterase|nr:hypothetical protein [Clostridia bacterium]